MPFVPRTRPPYKNVPRTLGPLLYHLITGAPTSLSATAGRLFDGMVPPPQLSGEELVPRAGPFLLVFNHYENRRVPAWWGPLVMARAVSAQRQAAPRELHLVMTREWWYPAGSFGRAFKQPVTRLVFARLARLFGLALVPPVITGDLTRGEGVVGVRQALALTRGPDPQLVAVAPEGHTGPNGALKEPPPGAGLFLLLLTHNAVPCLPAGWYADERQVLTVRFGRPFRLEAPRSQDREARDRAAATQAMTAIGRLLPSRLWGAYSGQLAGT